MSEDLYGQPATEAAHGHFPVHSDPPPDPVLTPTEAAEQIGQQDVGHTPLERPIVERKYYNRNEAGEFTSQIDERGTVSAEEAARDLAASRQSELEELARQEREAIAQATDELRRQPHETGQQPAAQLGQPQQQPVQQPEYQQPPRTNDEMRTQLANAIAQADQSLATETDPNLRNYYQDQRALLQQRLNEATWAKAFEQHPELVGMVEAEIANKVAAQTAQVQQYQQQQPEFRGLNPQDIPAAMKIMQRDAPERAAQISARTQAASQLVQQHQARAQQAAQAQAEAQRANFLNWAHQQDLAFHRANPGVTQELKDETMRMLRGTGLRDSDIAQLYNSAPWFRNAATQALLKDAAEARLARKSLREHRAAPPPAKVMRPGSGSDVDLRRDYEAAPRLPSEFANAKEAAAFITKVRAARR